MKQAFLFEYTWYLHWNSAEYLTTRQILGHVIPTYVRVFKKNLRNNVSDMNENQFVNKVLFLWSLLLIR